MNYIIGIFVLLAAAVLAAYALKKRKEIPASDSDSGKPVYRRITAQQAKEMLDNNPDAVLLDVRTLQEYTAKRIKGAVLIPNYELAQKAPRELPEKDKLILVYCMSGSRSKASAKLLASLGYTNVYDFGSIMAYPYGTISG